MDIDRYLIKELDTHETLLYLLDQVERLSAAHTYDGNRLEGLIDAERKERIHADDLMRQSLAAVAVQGPKGEPGEVGCTGPRGPAGKDADESKIASLQEQLHDLRERFDAFLNGDYYQRHTIGTPAYGVTPAHH